MRCTVLGNHSQEYAGAKRRNLGMGAPLLQHAAVQAQRVVCGRSHPLGRLPQPLLAHRPQPAPSRKGAPAHAAAHLLHAAGVHGPDGRQQKPLLHCRVLIGSLGIWQVSLRAHGRAQGVGVSVQRWRAWLYRCALPRQ